MFVSQEHFGFNYIELCILLHLTQQSQIFDWSQLFDQSQIFDQAELPTSMTSVDDVDDEEEESEA